MPDSSDVHEDGLLGPVVITPPTNPKKKKKVKVLDLVVMKFNENHDSHGQFTTGSGSVIDLSASGRKGAGVRVTATHGGKTVGSLLATPDGSGHYSIALMDVDKSYRRQGIASAMLKHARANSDLAVVHSTTLSPDGAAFASVVKVMGDAVVSSDDGEEMITPFNETEAIGKSRDEWLQGYRDLGMSETDAEAYTDYVLNGAPADVSEPGQTVPDDLDAELVSVEKALSLEGDVDLPGFFEAVHKYADSGVEFIKVSESEGAYFVEPVVEESDEEFGSAPVAKSIEEDRFTLAPMYVPGQYDAHGDWAESDDLQKAMWQFSKGDKLIALQHHPEMGPMGEAVEMMVIPWEHDVPMTKSDGTTENVHFPAGTPWLGTVWNENVWPLVKSGKIRGYSIGGRANLLDVALPDGAAAEIAKNAARAGVSVAEKESVKKSLKNKLLGT